MFFVHNFAKFDLLRTYVTVQRFDIIWLSEKYLDSCTPFDDDNLEISGSNLIRSDYLSNNKRGGACIYYKNFRARICNVSVMDKCINFKLKIGDKLCRLVDLYRYPSQTQDDLSFSQNFELTLEKLSENNPYILAAIGDFNAKITHC